MGYETIDPMKMVVEKPLKTVEYAAKIPGLGLAGKGVETLAQGLQVGEAQLTNNDVSTYLADRLGTDIYTLGQNSSLVATSLEYNKDGSALAGTLANAAADVAITGALGPVGAATKFAYDYSTSSEKPDPTGDLAVVFNFVNKAEITAEDVMAVIIAKAPPSERNALKNYGADGFGADNIIVAHVGDLIDADFNPREESIAQYLARKFNSGEYEKAVLVLNNPIPIRPIEVQNEVEQFAEVNEAEQVSPVRTPSVKNNKSTPAQSV